MEKTDTERWCLRCEAPLVGRAAHARYCSKHCRQMAYRERKGLKVSPASAKTQLELAHVQLEHFQEQIHLLRNTLRQTQQSARRSEKASEKKVADLIERNSERETLLRQENAALRQQVQRQQEQVAEVKRQVAAAAAERQTLVAAHDAAVAALEERLRQGQREYRKLQAARSAAAAMINQMYRPWDILCGRLANHFKSTGAKPNAMEVKILRQWDEIKRARMKG